MNNLQTDFPNIHTMIQTVKNSTLRNSDTKLRLKMTNFHNKRAKNSFVKCLPLWGVKIKSETVKNRAKTKFGPENRVDKDSAL